MTRAVIGALIVTSLVGSMAGCGNEPGAAAGQGQATAPLVVPAPEAVAVAPAPSAPSIDLRPTGGKRMREAQRLNEEGLAAHEAKDYAAAKVKFTAAVVADPGNVMARYNLACAHNLAGDGARALAILKEIGDLQCPACIGRLVRAREDSDWQSQWGTPAFVALTKDAQVEQGPLADLTRRVANAHLDGKLDDLAALVDARQLVTLDLSTDGCSEDEDCPSYKKTVTGFAAVRKYLAEYETLGLLTVGDVHCAKQCCDVDIETPDDAPDAVLSNHWVGRVCFATDSGGVSRLREIVVFDGGI